MEMSHRSKVFIQIFEETQAKLRRLMKVPDNYKTVSYTHLPGRFLRGGCPGAVRVPLHPRRPGQNADRHGAGPHDPLPAGESGTVSGMTSFSQPSGGEAQRTAAGPA